MLCVIVEFPSLHTITVPFKLVSPEKEKRHNLLDEQMFAFYNVPVSELDFSRCPTISCTNGLILGLVLKRMVQELLRVLGAMKPSRGRIFLVTDSAPSRYE